MNAAPQGRSRSELSNAWGQGAIGGGGLPPLIFQRGLPGAFPHTSSRIQRLRRILLDASI